jgi:FkbM family methyltransferase
MRGKGLRLRVERDHIAVVDPRGGREIWIGRANAVYAPDMATSFDYYFDAVEPFTQPALLGGHQVVDYSTPRFQRVAGFPDFPILCPSLVEPYATCEQYLDLAQLSEGDTVLDLGCYSGLTAIAFSKAVGATGRVVSLEPDAGNYAAATTNIDLYARVSGIRNIDLLPLAVSDTKGTLTFSSEGSMGSSATDIVGGFRGTVTEIDCTTLDDLAEQAALDRVDFIKMDIEGSELAVVRSGGDFLRRYKPRMIIEPHVVDGELDADAVIGHLSEYGYRCQIIEQWGASLPLITAVP